MMATMKWMAALTAALWLAIPVSGQSEILGRPTDRSITVTALADGDLEVFFEYGTATGIYSGQTAPASFPADTPIEVVLDGLEPNTRYYYRMRSREPGAGAYAEGPEYTFHTARPRGESYTVAIQADPHMDGGSSPELFRLTLGNELLDQPDFLVDLGDIFMSDKLRPATFEGVAARHLELRDYYELVCHSMPLFIVLGNHEGEWGTRLDGTPDNLPIWATRLRKLYYPNPFPDGFYTGSTREEPFVGLRENYCAWEWGDALFVVLDPYWYTPAPPESRSDGWSLTLGREQYKWLKRTLETSEATFKFVFCHNLVGGLERNGKMRGGIEAAKYFEWGGHEEAGGWGFDRARPGWEMPIHQLLVANNVTIFFHGHDHLYARQDLDGVVYHELPQPSHPNAKVANRAREYGYVNGDIVDGSGHLRLRVSPTEVTADFIRAWLPKDENQGRVNGEVAFSYTIPASRKRLTTTSAADFSSVVAPESIVSAFGEDLGGEISVTVRDSAGSERVAEVIFGAANQVNFVVPAGTAVGVAAVTILADSGSSVTGDLFVHPVAPALFSANANGAGPAAAVVEHIRGDGSRSTQLTFECSAGAGRCAAVPIDLSAPADEAYLSLYGTGIRGHAGLDEVRVEIGGVEATVLYAGPQPEFPGLDQVNVRIPKALAGRGSLTVLLTVAGKSANAVRVNIR